MHFFIRGFLFSNSAVINKDPVQLYFEMYQRFRGFNQSLKVSYSKNNPCSNEINPQLVNQSFELGNRVILSLKLL